ncbi:MAG: copper resistance protein CopC [Ilumatobacteraceae bacterium]
MKPVSRMVIAAAALSVGALIPASEVLAHGELLGSEPAASSVLADSPTQIVLHFNESIEPVFESIRILDSSGNEVVAADAQRDSTDHSTVRAPTPHLENGTYVVVWRVTSADGHPVQGAFPFYVGAEQENVTGLVTTFLHSYHADPSGSKVSAMLRWIMFVGVIVLIGSLMMSGMLAKPADLDPRSVIVIVGAWLFAVFGSAMALIAYGPNATGTSLYNLSLLGDTMRTAFGQAAAARLGLLAATAMMFYFRRHISPRAWWLGAIALSIPMAATFSLSGHPVVQHPAWFSVALDIAHLLAVSAWIGGIAILSLGGSFWYETQNGLVIRRFSRIAFGAVFVIIATGVTQAWLMMDGLGSILSTNFGRTLLVKTTAVLVLICLGAMTRFTLKRFGSDSVKRTIGYELFIGLVIVAISALLVGTPPRQSQAAETFSAILVRSSVIANLTITPARVGQAELHLIVTPPGGALEQVVSVSARMSLPERNIPNIPIEIFKIGPNHYAGIVDLAYSGAWDLELIVVPTKNTTLLYQTTFQVTT